MSDTFGLEIDFLPVGDGSKSGDAILVRWGNLSGPRTEQTIMLIDGGFEKTAADSILPHLEKYYGNPDAIDLVVNTHPDGDHVGGLAAVLEQKKFGLLLMHLPWSTEHTSGIADCFVNGRVTDKSVRERLKDGLEQARTLEQKAKDKSIEIIEPFLGVGGNVRGVKVEVLGPSKEFYEGLLPEFRATPDPKETLLEAFSAGIKKAATWLKEFFDEEVPLTGGSGTTAENNSSVILRLTVIATGEQFVFTGDAGIPAFEDMLSRNPSLKPPRFIQVPHHGSIHNVSSGILDSLLGPKGAADIKQRTAYVSVAQKGAEANHPAKRVLNAFRRRGTYVYQTGGKGIHHRFGVVPDRQGWSSVDPHDFYSKAEDLD